MQNIYFKQTNIIFSKTKMIMKQNYCLTNSNGIATFINFLYL